MVLEVCTVGGFGEVGKNMVAIKYNSDVVIVDMGIFLPALLNLDEGEDRRVMGSAQLKAIGAVPNDSFIKDWRKKVKAIVLGHCHLDHIGAVPYLAKKYNCPIYGTPYTIQVLKSILKDERINLSNSLRPLMTGKIIKLSKDVSFELVHITHSTLQPSIVAIHTPEGVALYANDFKLDPTPLYGAKPDIKRLKELAKKGIKVVFLESLYAPQKDKTPSEKVAKEKLRDVLLNKPNKGKAIFVTTFASHLVRIGEVIEIAKKLNRKVIILGRSMGKYIGAAEDLRLVNYSKTAQIFTYRNQIKTALKRIQEDKGKYLVLCTGNQAEPNSVLDRIVGDQFHFKFDSGDCVVFSCRIIPEPMNEQNRAFMESKLKKRKVKVFVDVHVSGHSHSEDLKEFIRLMKPEHIVPAHGKRFMEKALEEISVDEGYVVDKNVHIMKDGERKNLN